MNVYDTANKLAGEIKTSEEYNNFIEPLENSRPTTPIVSNGIYKFSILIIVYHIPRWLKNTKLEAPVDRPYCSTFNKR